MCFVIHFLELLQSPAMTEVDVDGLDISVAGKSKSQYHIRREELDCAETYFDRAYSPSSRPIPDCLYPPKGTCACSWLTQLIQAVPAWSLCAVSMARLMSCVKTAAARP